VPGSPLVTGQLLAAHSGGHHGLRILILVLILAAVIAAAVFVSRTLKRRNGPPAASPDAHAEPPGDGR
jgi:hypothetical protein